MLYLCGTDDSRELQHSLESVLHFRRSGGKCCPHKRRSLSNRKSLEKCVKSSLSQLVISGTKVYHLPQLVKAGTKADAVIIDPPRKGCDEGVLHAIIRKQKNQLSDLSTLLSVFFNHL